MLLENLRQLDSAPTVGMEDRNPNQVRFERCKRFLDDIRFIFYIIPVKQLHLMPLFLEQGAKVMKADGRSLYIFDVDAIDGKEGVNEGNLHFFRQMISLLLPEGVCDNVTFANIFLYGERSCLKNSLESVEPIISILI